MVFTKKQMVMNIMELGKMIKLMDKGYLHGKMEINMMENLLIIKSRGLEY